MNAPELPPQVESAEALLRKQLGKLLTLEEALARTVLPKLQQEAQHQQLQQTFAEHLEQTREKLGRHATRLAEQGAKEPAVR
jgi:hypothetical protein